MFRIFLQREFMQRDLGSDHDAAAQRAWVENNAEKFSLFYDALCEEKINPEELYSKVDATTKERLLDRWYEVLHRQKTGVDT